MNDECHLEKLRFRYNSGEILKYIFFWGHKQCGNRITSTCLSQWHESPFIVNGERFKTAEHFMMAEKASLFDDVETREKILNADTPKIVKALGRAIRGFDESIWVKSRFSIVVRGNVAKFRQNPEIGAFLCKSDASIIVEASPVDRIWGIGMSMSDQRICNPNLWDGLNLLGFALMQVRDELMSIKKL